MFYHKHLDLNDSPLIQEFFLKIDNKCTCTYKGLSATYTILKKNSLCVEECSDTAKYNDFNYKVTVIKETVWYITRMNTKTDETEHSSDKKSHMYTDT